MAEGFIEKITVKDKWVSGNEEFRLVDRSAGPWQLQIKKNGKWVPESDQYVHSLLCSRIEQLTRERIAWEEIARQNQRNTDFYRDLIEQCGKTIGREAYTQDDGGVCEDVLCLKVPELVKGLVS